MSEKIDDDEDEDDMTDPLMIGGKPEPESLPPARAQKPRKARKPARWKRKPGKTRP